MESFYHSLTRKYVIVFGNLFSDIVIQRVNKQNSKVQNIPVPIRYGPKAKYYIDIFTPPEDQKVNVVMPLISFYDATVSPDSDRQLNGANIIADNDPTLTRTLQKLYQPVPFKIGMEMTILTKTVEDAAQIYEQIVPFFTPFVSRSVRLIDGLEPYDIQITLTGLNKRHAYEELRQVVEWTITFDMSVWFFGPKENQGVIKKTIVSFINEENQKKLATVTTQPGLTPDGKPTTKLEESIDFKLIKPDDDYGFIENIEEFIK